MVGWKDNTKSYNSYSKLSWEEQRAILDRTFNGDLWDIIDIGTGFHNSARDSAFAISTVNNIINGDGLYSGVAGAWGE